MKKTCTLLLFALVMTTAFAHSPRLSFDFRENLGQWPSQVLYKASMGGSTVFLEQNTMTWVLAHPEDFALVHESSEWDKETLDAWQFRGHAYKVNFVGGTTENVVGQDEQSYYYNYFIGNNPDKWASYVPAFSAVRYADVWDGIGLRVYNSDSQFKYDFIVGVGANANLIQLSYDGIDSMELSNGNLLLHTSVGDVIEQAPYAYQMVGNQLEEVECNYVLQDGKMSFEFPNGYDESRKLIIDPLVIASTLSGTVGSDNYGHCAAYDIAGNIFTGARSFGSGYPTDTGSFQEIFGNGGGGFGVDMAFSKLNPDGTDLLWASYLGGSGSDLPHSIIANEFEELYTFGTTSSDDYPTTDGAYDETPNGGVDIGIAHFSDDGASLIGGTLIGGTGDDGGNGITNNYGDNYRGEIVLDYNGNPAIASSTRSDDFPTTGGAYGAGPFGGANDQDAILCKFNPTLTSLTWSSYFGGVNGDAGFGMRFATDGSVYMAGGTASADLPASAGAYQTTTSAGQNSGYIAHFSADANDLLECTYYGGNEADNIFFLDLDNDENIWVYGQTQSDLPITDGVYSEENGTLFITKFDPTLSNLVASSRVAAGTWGSGGVPIAFLVDRCDNIYISAHGATTGLVTTDDAVYTEGGFYLAAYGPEIETLEFATYYGANHVDGGTSRFDKNGIVYQGVCTIGGFPTNDDAWASDQDGWDIGVFKMDFQVSGVNAQLTASAEALNGCAPHNIDFNNFSVGDVFEWDFGDGSPINNEFEPSHEYTDPGVYTVRLISSDSLSCNLADTAYLEISVSEPIDFNAAFNLTLNCEDLSVTTENLTGIEWLDYEWDMGDGTILNGENVEHVYGEEGEFTVTLNAVDNGCIADDQAEEVVQIVGSVEASSLFDDYEGCGELEVTFENTSNGVTYQWDFGDGSPVTTEENPTHTFGPGQYEVQLTAFHPESCNLEDDTTLLVTVGIEQDIEAAFQLLQTDCENLLVEGTNQSVGENLAFTWDMDDGTTYESEDINHNYAATGNYDIALQITDTLCNITDTQVLSVNVLEEVAAIIGNPNIEGCDPFLAEFSNNSAGTNFYWDFGDGSPIEEAQIASHEYAEAGVYDVTLIVEGVGNCGGMDTTYATVTVIETPTIEALFTMEQQGACEAMSVNFDNESIGENLNYSWDVDGVEYSVAEFDHVFNGPGNYTITLTIDEPVCDATDTFSDQIQVLEGIELEVPEDIYMCYYEEQVELYVTGPSEAEYLWDTEDTGFSTVVTGPGIYTVTATQNNCTDAVGIEVIDVAELDLLDTPRACEGLQTLLEIPYDQGTNYLWCNGEPADFIYASEAGEYCYQFTDEFGCTQEGLVVLEHISRDAEVFIPNAFTPNNDGINDVFQPVAADVRDYRLTIWNRWGDMVFETESTDAFWDGSNNGSDHYVQNEVYSYQVEYNGTCNAEKILVKGNVLLMR